MSRLATKLPIVERRSPPITTPSAQLTATMVVACGATAPCAPAGRGRRPGSRSGATWVSSSLNEDEPDAWNASGSRPEKSRPAGTELPSRETITVVVATPYAAHPPGRRPGDHHGHRMPDRVPRTAPLPDLQPLLLAALLDIAP